MTIIDWCLDRLEPIYDLLADVYGLLDRLAEYMIEALEDVIRMVRL